MILSPTAGVRVPHHVVYRNFAAETVVLNLETGRYHGLNPVGGRMLEVLERSPSVERAAVTLAAEYGRPRDEVRADLIRFCEDLSGRGLIEVVAAARA